MKSHFVSGSFGEVYRAQQGETISVKYGDYVAKLHSKILQFVKIKLIATRGNYENGICDTV